MNEEGIPIFPLLVASLVLCYFGLEVNRQRNKLRSIFNVFDRGGADRQRTRGVGRQGRARAVRGFYSI